MIKFKNLILIIRAKLVKMMYLITQSKRKNLKKREKCLKKKRRRNVKMTIIINIIKDY